MRTRGVDWDVYSSVMPVDGVPDYFLGCGNEDGTEEILYFSDEIYVAAYEDCEAESVFFKYADERVIAWETAGLRCECYRSARSG